MKYIAEMANYKTITKEKQTLIKTQRTKALKSKEFKELLNLGLEVVNTKIQDDNMTIALSSKLLELDRKAQFGGSAHRYEYFTYLITVNFDEPKSVKKPSGPDRFHYGTKHPFLYKVIWDAHITSGRKWVQFPNMHAYRHSSLINIFKDIKVHYKNKIDSIDSQADTIINLMKTTDIDDFRGILTVYYKKHGNDFSSYIKYASLKSNEKLQKFLIEFFDKNIKFLYKSDELLKAVASEKTIKKIEKGKEFLGKQFGFFGS